LATLGTRKLKARTPADAKTITVENPDQLAFVSQTTLSVDDTEEIINSLRERFPAISAPKRDDICYATQNRQDAVKALCSKVDLLLVVGAANSSNSNRLRELGERAGVESHLITRASDIPDSWLSNKKTVGVTAGASAPEVLVQEVIDRLRNAGGKTVVEHDGIEETISFSIPKELRRMSVPGQT